VTKACSDLFFKDKDPSDETICDFVYTSLVNVHPEEIAKIKKLMVVGKIIGMKYFNLQ